MEKIMKMLHSERIKNFIYYIANYSLRMIYCLVSLMPVRKKRICFSNYNGKGYGDNPKYVADVLLKYGCDAEILWVVSGNNEYFPDNVVPVKLYSLGGLLAFATSKVWVSNTRLPLFLRKKKTQKYFQLWHGGCGPKKVEGAAEENLIRWYVSCAKHDSRMADYFVSNSRFNSDLIQKYFWYEGEILNYGSPRHDIFFKNPATVRQAVLKKLRVPEECGLILYAPTFRNDKQLAVYQWEYDQAIEAFERKYQKILKLVIRLHPNISFEAGDIMYSESVINGSSYDDAQELIMAADAVITDYSGIMMQAAIARKLVFLLMPDRESYMSERGLCLDIREMPFPSASNVKELCSRIDETNIENYKKQLEQYLMKFGFYDDGKASMRVCEKIIESLKE